MPDWPIPVYSDDFRPHDGQFEGSIRIFVLRFTRQICMAGKYKLRQFAEVTSFPNVLEAFDFEDGLLNISRDKQVRMKGAWRDRFFGNDHPLCLELACGKGEYSVGLARLYPHRNFVGVDIKGNRIWKGASEAIHHNLANVGFLRSRIEFINHYFSQEEVSEIWIVFPDPFLRYRDHKRRLTSRPFLDRYRDLLKDQSILHLKTDSEELYRYTLSTIEAHENFTLEIAESDIDQHPRSEELAIRTYYEKQHIGNGKTIKYIRARFRASA